MSEQHVVGAFSIPAFCRTYSIGRSTVYAEIRCGRLASLKVGRRRLISAEAAAAWLRAREAEAGGRAA